MIALPTTIGMGMDLDPDKIEREKESNFGS
jgi:hypothetical protein